VRKLFVVCGLVTFAFLAHAQQVPARTDTNGASAEEVERVRVLVEAGAAPRAALERAQAAVEDRLDEAILRQTLYGAMRPEETTGDQAREMLAAAQRRVARVKARLEQMKPLVESGIMARMELTPILEELDYRQKTLSLAESRGNFLRELAEMAQREIVAETEQPGEPADKPAMERFDGNGSFSPAVMKRVILAFEKRFARPIPISALGETAFHKSMGFDHRGRMDVALNPDSDEGQWLKQYLEAEGVPHYAFRNAVAGRATGAHFHIGPPSARLRVAD
jgi:hypothetical protein